MSPMNQYTQKIAIVRLSALGDIVNSSIVLQFINSKYPEAQIDWITEEAFAPLLKHHPSLHAVHTINLKKLKKEKSLKLFFMIVKKLRSLNKYDLVIDMQGLLKSAIVSRILGSNVHGFDKNSIREPIASLFYNSSSNISYQTNVVKRNFFLVADSLKIEINNEMILNKKPIFEITKKFNFSHGKKNIAFVIGASWPSKIYPKEFIAKICDELKEECHIIWGSDDERLNAEWICTNSEFASLAPKLELDELASFISGMDLLIGNDTGPTHLAWAQNIPSITLLGPTTTRMIQETSKNIGIKSSSKVNLLKINKNDFSIKDIPSERVLTKAKELLYGL